MNNLSNKLWNFFTPFSKMETSKYAKVKKKIDFLTPGILKLIIQIKSKAISAKYNWKAF